MKRNTLSNIFSSLLSLYFLSSCFAEQRLNFEKSRKYETLNIPFAITEIQIIDERQDVTDGPMKLPFPSFPGLYRRQSPVLTAEHRAVIEETVNSSVRPGNNIKAKLVVTVKEAYKEFSIVDREQEERSSARIRMDLTEISGQQRRISGTWTDYFYVRSWDATHKRSEEIYRLALQKATYGCLQKIEEQIAN
jgi:hypothetical protein